MLRPRRSAAGRTDRAVDRAITLERRLPDEPDMALADALPSPGLLDMIQLGASLALAGPLIVATYLFAAQGDFAMAGFCAVVAVLALYLPTYVVKKAMPSSILPARVRRFLDWLPFR